MQLLSVSVKPARYVTKLFDALLTDNFASLTLSETGRA